MSRLLSYLRDEQERANLKKEGQAEKQKRKHIETPEERLARENPDLLKYLPTASDYELQLRGFLED